MFGIKTSLPCGVACRCSAPLGRLDFTVDSLALFHFLFTCTEYIKVSKSLICKYFNAKRLETLKDPLNNSSPIPSDCMFGSRLT